MGKQLTNKYIQLCTSNLQTNIYSYVQATYKQIYTAMYKQLTNKHSYKQHTNKYIQLCTSNLQTNIYSYHTCTSNIQTNIWASDLQTNTQSLTNKYTVTSDLLTHICSHKRIHNFKPPEKNNITINKESDFF